MQQDDQQWSSWIFTLLLLMMSCAGVVAAPCRTDITREWVVNDTASATALAEVVNCSGGVFDVEWKGNVLVDRDIHVENGTSLSVAGIGSDAGIDGGGNTRIFTVTNAFLNVSNVEISDGNATDGGAIASYGSSLSFIRTSFIGNVAVGNGGAIHIVNSSALISGGRTTFVRNRAGDGGGAVYVGANSSVYWEAETSFSNNTAKRYGGALTIVDGSGVFWGAETWFSNNTSSDRGGAVYVEDYSKVSWEAKTSFFGNAAALTGGALNVYNRSSVFWEAETSFSNNTAKWGGAVHVEDHSNASWEAETFFFGNTAEGDDAGGAALDVYNGSTASWGGLTTFIGNTAKKTGGAVSANTNCEVSWTAETSFSSNFAQYGGAIYIADDSRVSWEAGTLFSGNTANWSGGALTVYDGSSASWAAETSFANNSAKYGGGIIIDLDSTVSWEAKTRFSGNAAEGSGGALNLLANSNVYWEAGTSFSDNSAEYAGAIFANRSSVSWEAETSFSGNAASQSGGAVLIEYGSSLSWGAVTSFRSNEARVSGGAVSIGSSVSDSEDVFSSFIIKGATTFLENTCGSSGGGMAMIGAVDADFRTENITFIRNVAGVAGGAVFVAGLGVGPKFSGVKFISNAAFVGGGVYVTGSGTAVTNYEFLDPTTFTGCQFIGNTAETTGGAVDSGAGQDVFNNTRFMRNTASGGGALSLAGTASLYDCRFVENTSAEGEGPAVSSLGSISTIYNASFVGNVFECEEGKFLADAESDDFFDTVCSGCTTDCTECDFGPAASPSCAEAPQHSWSDGGTDTIDMLSIESGYWRATNISEIVLACYNADACIGGKTGEAGYCDDGYEGPYCSICSKDYTTSTGYTCNECSDITGGVVLACVIGVVAIILFAVLLAYMVSEETGGSGRGIAERVIRHIPLQSLKTIIVAWQILTQFAEVANVTYPDVYQTFLDGVDLFNFDLSWILSTGCIFDMDFHECLLVSTIGPPVGVAVLGATFSLAVRKNRGSEAAVCNVRRKHLSMVLLLTFVIYSSVSSTLFQMFGCDELEDGHTYLRADYRIECDSSRHRALQIYAGFMIVLYPVGIPLFYAVLLFRNRDALMKEAGRETDTRLRPTTDLWKPYRPDRFYYEVIECGRRILLAGVVVFIYPDTAAQVAVTILIAVFFIFVSEALSPYASRWDTWVSRIGHAVVFTSMYLALLLKVDVSNEHASSQRVFEVILVSAHVLLISAVLIEAVVVAYSLRTREQEDPSPSFQGSGVLSFELREEDSAVDCDLYPKPDMTDDMNTAPNLRQGTKGRSHFSSNATEKAITF